jgi:hypothetical protein
MVSSRPGRFTPKERAPGTHWIKAWVGPRSVLDTAVKRKIPSPRRESNPRTPIFQPVGREIRKSVESVCARSAHGAHADVGTVCFAQSTSLDSSKHNVKLSSWHSVRTPQVTPLPDRTHFVKQTTGIRSPSGVAIFYPRHRLHTGSGAHPAYPVGSRSSFPRDKAAESWRWRLPSCAEVKNGGTPPLPNTSSWHGA